METILTSLLIFIPLAGFAILLFSRKLIGKFMPGYIATGAVAISFLISTYFFIQIISTGEAIPTLQLFDWIKIGGFTASMAFSFDQLTMLWLMFVTGIGTLIHIYSISYMKGDEGVKRYFSYLNLFIFFMIVLVTGSNLLVMFIGWEGVGLCSYLLIGFWSRDHKNNNAAKKAFVMNRIGDLAFLVAIFSLIYLFNTVDFDALKLAVSTPADPKTTSILGIATLCLFIGAMGKSAQIPLYTWLPDAMAGPTPVSALIHAATMVTAGIFMITRLNFIFDLTPHILEFIAVIGAVTALFAASIGTMQNDIKKVLAYSTVSQLGLMFLAIGCGAYHVAVFHVVTHAFFKACLFLGAGSVIHGMGGEQDIRKMGGLSKPMKITFVTFFISTCSISGIPLFAGFFSKDEIMFVSFEHNKILWILAALASLMTAFYMFRVLFLTFYKNFRGTKEQKEHLHESPKQMTTPLIILAILAVVGGAISLPFGYNWLNAYLTPVLPKLAVAHHAGATTWVVMGISTFIALVGLGEAYYRYMIKSAVPCGDSEYKGFGKVVYNKYYIDEIYNTLFVKPLYVLSGFFQNYVEKFITLMIALYGIVVSFLSYPAKRLQNGSVGFYLTCFVLGFCSLLVLLFFVY